MDEYGGASVYRPLARGLLYEDWLEVDLKGLKSKTIPLQGGHGE